MCFFEMWVLGGGYALHSMQGQVTTILRKGGIGGRGGQDEGGRGVKRGKRGSTMSPRLFGISV
jgi:hypothetical protein